MLIAANFFSEVAHYVIESAPIDDEFSPFWSIDFSQATFNPFPSLNVSAHLNWIVYNHLDQWRFRVIPVDAEGARGERSNEALAGPTATIGPEGGTLSYWDGRATLVVPPGAVPEETDFYLRQTSAPTINVRYGFAASGIYIFWPQSVYFCKPASFAIRYEEDRIPDAFPEEELTVARLTGEAWSSSSREGESWASLESQQDPEGNTVTADVFRLGSFTAAALPPRTTWLSADVNEMCLRDSCLIAGCGSRGLKVFDVSNPEMPTRLWEAHSMSAFPGAGGLDASGDYCYVTSGKWLLVYDISSPHAPELLGAAITPYNLSSLCLSIQRNLAYASSMDFGLVVIDLSEPTSPKFVSSVETEPQVMSIDASGDYVYLAASNNGLCIIDTSDPLAPYILTTFQVTGGIRSVSVRGNYAYCGLVSGGLAVIDVSSPANPVMVSSASTMTLFGGEDIYTSGDYAYVANGECGLTIVDISDPLRPEIVRSLSTPLPARAVFIEGGYAYVSCRGWSHSEFIRSLLIIELEEQPNPEPVVWIDIPGSSAIREISVEEGYAYIAAYGDGLQIVDVRNPVNPTHVSSLSLPGLVDSVAVNEDYAYVAAAYEGLQIVDISNRENPVAVGAVSGPSVHHVRVSGNYAYATGSWPEMLDGSWLSGLFIFDISEPSAPEMIWLGQTNLRTLEVSNGYLYGERGYDLYIVDVSDPANPTEVATLEMPTGSKGLYVSDGYLFVAHCFAGLFIADVHDPTCPVLVGWAPIDGYLREVFANSKYAYVTVYNVGIQVVDVSNPARPAIAATLALNPRGDFEHIFVDGDYLYASWWGGLLVVDVSDFAVP